MKKFIFISCVSITVIILWTSSCVAQCCSPGNPIGGTGALGVLDSGSIKVFLNYKYGYSGSYFEGGKPSQSDFILNGSYDFTGVNLLYGISKRTTIELGTGYFLNKTQNYVQGILPKVLIGSGFSDINIGVKLNIFKSESKEIELTSGLSLKVPLGAYDKQFKGVTIPFDLQPSTGATDYNHTVFLYKGYLPQHLRFFLINRIEFKGLNTALYQFGNLYSTSVFVSYSISKNWVSLVQFRSEVRERDTRPSSNNGIQLSEGREAIRVTGSQKIFVIPQLMVQLPKHWTASLLADFPIYQFYNKKQLATSYAFALSVSKEFKQ